MLHLVAGARARRVGGEEGERVLLIAAVLRQAQAHLAHNVPRGMPRAQPVPDRTGVRAEYALTDKGRELRMIVGALAAWGTRHVYEQAKRVHAGCGHPVKLGYCCPDCRERVRGTEVALKRHRPARKEEIARA